MASIASGREIEVYGSLDRVGRILRRGVLAGDMAATEDAEGLFTLVLIHLADTMAYLRNRGMTASFQPGTAPAGFADDALTDFTLAFRNIACHVSSGDRSLPSGSRFTYGVIHGGKTDRQLEGVTMSCEYPDDVAFLFGESRIYLKRHIEHAFQSAVKFMVEKMNYLPPPSLLMPRIS